MGFFDWFKTTPALDTRLRERVEFAATRTDSRIRQLPGYEGKLAAAVETAFDYCERIALAVPGPFYLSHSAFANDPLMHALFGSADDIATMLASSQPLRDYLAANPAASGQPVYAMLGMRCNLHAGFGTRLSGGIIRHDEPQTTLNFSDHTLEEPSAALDDLQRRLAMRFYESLLQGLAEQIETQRQHLFELREHLALDKAMYRSAADAARKERIDRLQEQIAEQGDKLMPAALIPMLNDYLGTASTRLRLTPSRLRVDRLGIVAAAGDQDAQADTIRLAELATRDQRHWVVMCVRFDHSEARHALEQMNERRRYMVI